MKIGILGGTFDPIHNAHIYMAKRAMDDLKLDKLYFMPSPCPPHKDKKHITSEEHRVNMIKLAINDYINFELSDFELKNNLSYTADTLTALKKVHKNDSLYFIIGGDSAASFTSWYHPDVILSNANLVIINRKDENCSNMEEIANKIEKEFSKKVYLIKGLESDISSTFIRTNQLEQIKDMVDSKVFNYIQNNKLYTTNYNRAWSVSKIKTDLKQVLKPSRYEHTLGVADTAKKMAEVYGVNPNKAYIAGILHDCAKYYTDEELLKCCKENNIVVTKFENIAPYLLHGKVGAHVALKKYGIEETEILEAIKWHTTGKENMTVLEQIIFCADYIEPNRTKQPHLSYLRNIAMKDLDLLTYSILKDTLEYLKSKKCIIDDYTQQAYKYYKNKLGELL